MAITQTQYGKAYEYACLKALEGLVNPYRPVAITANTSLVVAKNAWQSLNDDSRQKMQLSSVAGIQTLIKMEPKIVEDGYDPVTLSLQPDSKGQQGDVRDVLIIRRDINWEIGISVKHNHTAVKHSRLAPGIDFGKQWFGMPCAPQYFLDIAPVFSVLKAYSISGKKWSDVPKKATEIYVPLLAAFRTELLRLDSGNPGVVPAKLLEYLLGRTDFYKLTSDDQLRVTTVQCFNLRGTLNKPSSKQLPTLRANPVRLPAKIYHFDYKDTLSGSSQTTLQLVTDEDWAISFRLHSARTLVEQSLKFDIQLTGVPSKLFANHAQW